MLRGRGLVLRSGGDVWAELHLVLALLSDQILVLDLGVEDLVGVVAFVFVAGVVGRGQAFASAPGYSHSACFCGSDVFLHDDGICFVFVYGGLAKNGSV